MRERLKVIYEDLRGARDAIKLALLGFRHSVEWWGLPTRLEWALAPDRGALGYQTGSLAARMAFGLLAAAWALGAGTKALFFPVGCPRVVYRIVEAGGRSPGRVPGVTPWELSVACRIHAVTG